MKNLTLHFLTLILWVGAHSVHAAIGSAETGDVTVDTRDAPTVATPTAANLTATGATLGGNVPADGGASIIERGVVYSATATNNNPLIGGAGVTKIAGIGSMGVFTVAVTGLTEGTGYSYKAYAINSQGTSYTSLGAFTTLSANADLSALTLSVGTLKPVFASATTAYTASVGNTTTSITVTPTRAQANATMKVRINEGAYGSVTSGSASGALSLKVGANTLDVRVTAQDGATQNTYTVTVTRMDAPIVISPTVTSITATGATMGGDVTGDGGDAITECGVVYSATGSNSNPLIGGRGVTKVTATGTTGVFTAPAITGLTQGIGYSFKAYATNSQGTAYTSVSTFTTLSTNADLSNLTLSTGTLSPVFSGNKISYTSVVPRLTQAISVMPVKAHDLASISVRINGGDYNGVNTGAASGPLSLAVGSNYIDVRVTAHDGVTIKTYSVLVDTKDAPSFTKQPESMLVPLGSEVALETDVVGDSPIGLNWRRGATAIPSATSSILRIPSAKTFDVDAYSLIANNGVGAPQASDTAYLGVVSPLQGTPVIKAGGSLSLACTAAAPKLPGVNLSYAWKRGGVPLANGTQQSGAVVAGADKTALSITKLTATESGSYSCEVTMTTPGNDPVLSAGEVIVQVVDAVPVVDAIPLPERISVSQPVDVFITATNSPTSFSVSGLPAGLKLDFKTGRLTGRPTSPSKTDSLGADLPIKLSFKAANPFGTSAGRDWNLVIEPFDPQAVGTFHGIVAREGQSNFKMGGQVQITVASTGVVSGSATLAGQKHSIIGALNASLDGDPSALLQIKRSPATLGDLQLQINLGPAENKLTGSITDPRFIMRLGSLELGNPAEQGLVNGSMDEARFSGPRGVVLNSAGNGYIADTGNHVIRYVDGANGVVSTFAGNGSPGFADGTGTGGAFNSPEGLALDSSGNLYVADSGNSTIRRITPAGVVTTFAGSAGQVGTANGIGAAARFNQPCAICLDPMGNLYVVDRGNHTIRKITPLGVVTTLAGKADMAGHKDGSGTSALFNSPRGITYDPLLKALFVADTNNCVIRRVTLAGATTTYAGSPGVPGAYAGLLANARFLAPTGILSLGDGTLVVADTLLVQLNLNGTSGVISYNLYVDLLEHPVALALNPEDRTLIVAHDTLHALARHGATGQSPPKADLVAWRNVWNSTNLVPAANQGLYNAVLQTAPPVYDLGTPQGIGYAQVSISKSGAANWTGRAADGSTLTFSTVLAEDDSIPMHVLLYGNTGSLQGVAKIDFQTGDINEHVDHVLDWWKLPQPLISKDRSYKAGFMTTLELRGGRYTPNDLHGFLGLSGSPAAMALSFAQLPTDTFEQAFTLMDPNGVTVPSNTKGLSLKIDPKTGIFSGSYKDGSPTLTVNYAGILFNHQASGERKGLGHFLKPESSATNSPIGSAPVSLDEVGPQ